ncbi:hypothetical protein K0M31_016821 [Melipona bicolor]|uniref:Uncharacterized protein n=1 Tax=Melipona bicolor TaxID=60889 RepID=A0AA40KED4_9HYME|nr:hypothetical protein K0M31_016821 [Melipona bicolor]
MRRDSASLMQLCRTESANLTLLVASATPSTSSGEIDGVEGVAPATSRVGARARQLATFGVELSVNKSR